MRGSLLWSFTAVLAAAIGCSRPNPAYFVEFDVGLPGSGGGSSGGTGGARGDAAGPDQGMTTGTGGSGTGDSGATAGSGGSTAVDAGPVAPDTQPALDVIPPDAPGVDLRPADAGVVDAPRDAAPPDVALNPDLAPLPIGNGLLVELWDGTQLEDGSGSGWDRDWTGQMINFDWGAATPTGDMSFDDNNFSMRFRGQILPAYTERYTFTAESDEGVELWIDDILVLGNWTASGFSTISGSITLTGRVKHKFQMHYRESTGNASVKLFWSSPSLGAKQIVPKAALFYP